MQLIELMDKIFVIGIGLIGGSLCLKIRDINPNVEIYGIDISEEHLQQALESGIIDFKSSIDNISKANLVLLTTPVDISNNIITEILDRINEKAIVIDFGSTKSNICRITKNHKNRENFIATHPIAGTEFSGPKAAFSELFTEKTIIICDAEYSDNRLLGIVIDLFNKMKMKIRNMNSESHDKHIAYVSHLSHISSFMLGKTVMDKEKNENNIFDMAGSGFESTVRLAKSSPQMWSAIFKLNKKNILKSLDEYIINLNQFKTLIENENIAELNKEMTKTNHIKKILKGI
jgi:prephenate dehydrogenase